MPDPWYADGLCFTCTQCGNCCTGAPGYVWISLEEIDRLAAHLKLSAPEVIDRYCRQVNGRYSLNERLSPRGEYDCLFLHQQKTTPPPGSNEQPKGRRGCTIYPVRPLQCRTWPFWDGLLSAPEVWERATDRCPGMNHGKRYTLPQIHALKDAHDWPPTLPPPTNDARQ